MYIPSNFSLIIHVNVDILLFKADQPYFKQLLLAICFELEQKYLFNFSRMYLYQTKIF